MGLVSWPHGQRPHGLMALLVLEMIASSCCAQDLFISEVFNGGPDQLQYIEFYNPTNSSINLSESTYEVTILGASVNLSIQTIALTGRTVGPGLTHTVCSNNSISPGSMSFYDGFQSGLRNTQITSQVRSRYCHQYLYEGTFLDGDESIFLMKPTRIGAFLEQNWIDTFNERFEPVSICGFLADSSGYIFVRAPGISSGDTNWTRSSGRIGDSDDCYWNNHSGITTDTRILDSATLGFHENTSPNNLIKMTLSPNPAPSNVPTDHLYASEPTSIPTYTPTSSMPSAPPSRLPTRNPSTNPSAIPSYQPSPIPTNIPSSSSPTSFPSGYPSFLPTQGPTSMPSTSPTQIPSKSPTNTEPSLIISEVFSDGIERLQYVELYNPFEVPINLEDGPYAIEIVRNDRNQTGIRLSTEIRLSGVLGPARTTTICTNNTASIALGTCHHFLESGLSLYGDELVYLVRLDIQSTIPTYIDTFGFLPGTLTWACGVKAESSGYIFIRSQTSFYGQVDWLESNSTRDDGTCGWNDQSNISLNSRTPGFHESLHPLPQFRWTNMPSAAPTTLSPTTSWPTGLPTEFPTASPLSSSPSLFPTLSYPSRFPTFSPSQAPSHIPSMTPSISPTGTFLFISEIYDGGQSFEYIEIYNPTENTVDFSTNFWSLRLVTNSTSFLEFQLSGPILGPGMTHTMCFSSQNNEVDCTDAHGDATDRDGDDCEDYTLSPEFCQESSQYDDSDFRASHMCCACGGGRRELRAFQFATGTDFGNLHQDSLRNIKNNYCDEVLQHSVQISNLSAVYLFQGGSAWDVRDVLRRDQDYTNTCNFAQNLEERVLVRNSNIVEGTQTEDTSDVCSWHERGAPTIGSHTCLLPVRKWSQRPTAFVSTPRLTMQTISPTTSPFTTRPTVSIGAFNNTNFDSSDAESGNDDAEFKDYLIIAGITISSCFAIVALVVAFGKGNDQKTKSASNGDDLEAQKSFSENDSSLERKSVSTPMLSSQIIGSMLSSPCSTVELGPAKPTVQLNNCYYDAPYDVKIRFLNSTSDLGIEIVETPRQLCEISFIEPGSSAAASCLLEPGMIIHEVNGHDCFGLTGDEVLEIVQNSFHAGQRAIMMKIEAPKILAYTLELFDSRESDLDSMAMYDEEQPLDVYTILTEAIDRWSNDLKEAIDEWSNDEPEHSEGNEWLTDLVRRIPTSILISTFVSGKDDTALLYAIGQGKPGAVALLCYSGALSKRMLASGASKYPLHYFASLGHSSFSYEICDAMVEVLLQAGLFVDELNNSGYTPLDIAISSGNNTCEMILLDNNAEQSGDTSTPRITSLNTAEKNDIAEWEKTSSTQHSKL